MTAKLSAPDDPDCLHRSHYECVACRKVVCARCGAEMARASLNWQLAGYWCQACLSQKTP